MAFFVCTSIQNVIKRNRSLTSYTIIFFSRKESKCLTIVVLREGGVMVFNATSNNFSAISWRSVLLVEETVVPGENH